MLNLCILCTETSIVLVIGVLVCVVIVVLIIVVGIVVIVYIRTRARFTRADVVYRSKNNSNKQRQPAIKTVKDRHFVV